MSKLVILLILMFSCQISFAAGSCLAVEKTIRNKLSSTRTDKDFTLMVGHVSGNNFVFSKGTSSPQTAYESASTSKMVTAAVVWSLIDQKTLSLDSKPSDYLTFWREGTHPGLTLRHLLNFTSGLNQNVLCIHAKNFDFEECVKRIYKKNSRSKNKPGEAQSYSGTDLQIAGLMAIKASGAKDWHELFNQFKRHTKTFKSAQYNLPSRKNPRLSGGMTWTAAEYFEFLTSFYHETLFSKETHALLKKSVLADLRSIKAIGNSPPLSGLGLDWRYGYGFWLECASSKYNCSDLSTISSPGSFGAYPFIDYKNGIYGVLARQGKSGTYTEGYRIYKSVKDDFINWGTCSK